MGLIKLNRLWETWNKASQDFYKKPNRSSTTSSDSGDPVLLSLIPDQDDFVDHLLSLHRLHCKECHPAGETGQASPDDSESEAEVQAPRVPKPKNTQNTYGIGSQFKGSLHFLDSKKTSNFDCDVNHRRTEMKRKKQEKRDRKETSNDELRRKSLRMMDRAEAESKTVEELVMTVSGSEPTTKQEEEEHESSSEPDLLSSSSKPSCVSIPNFKGPCPRTVLNSGPTIKTEDKEQDFHHWSFKPSPMSTPKHGGSCPRTASDNGPTIQTENEERESSGQRNLPSWSSKLNPVFIPRFKGLNPGPSSPSPNDKLELTFFKRLFPLRLIDHIVNETNRFAEHCEGLVGRQWIPTTAYEMKAFLGLQILRSIKKCADLSIIWTMKYNTSEKINAWDVMHQFRFEALLKYFQPCSCSAHSDEGLGSDLKAKSRCSFFDTINDCCRLQYDPHQDCTVRETSIQVEGEEEIHLCLFVDSETGYCNEFRVFHPEKEAKDDHASRDALVLDLTRRLKRKQYIVNLSKSFTNVTLLRTLEGRGILGRGAVNCSTENTDALPDQLFCSSVRRNLVFQQGTMIACSWYNPVARRVVISTADDPKSVSWALQTYDGVKAMKSQSPTAVVRHMQCMYTTQFSNAYPTRAWSKRRGPCLFWFALDVAIENAFILKLGSKCYHRVTKYSFRKNLGKQLISDFREGFRSDYNQPVDTSALTMQSKPIMSSPCANANVQDVIPSVMSPPEYSADDGIQISNIIGGADWPSNPQELQDTKDISEQSNIEDVKPVMAVKGIGVQSTAENAYVSDDVDSYIPAKKIKIEPLDHTYSS